MIRLLALAAVLVLLAACDPGRALRPNDLGPWHPCCAPDSVALAP